jgi:hypothetical protein
LISIITISNNELRINTVSKAKKDILIDGNIPYNAIMSEPSIGIETGPGAIITGAVGSVIFGTVGYLGADWIADFIYKD